MTDVTEAIGVRLHAERINLLETLAARVAERILLLEPQAERVFVRIEKLDRGPFALGVEECAERDGMSPRWANPSKFASARGYE
jgi:dihydroneopterin aldolase